MPTSVYLSGPSLPISQADPSLPLQYTPDWKAYAASMFLRSGLTVANPIELDLSGFVTKVDESVQLSTVKHSLALIDKADCLLANLTQVSESTTMEMFYAHNQGKQVVVVGNEPYSPWVLFHSEARFQKLKEALEYLVKQQPGFDTIAWSSQFEANLKKKSEQYPPEGELDFEYYGGTLPVLVIAPHATSYFQEGNLYPGESYTGSMAVLLHKLSGCHSLITSYCALADPVYYLNSPFVNFLCQLTKKISLKLVLVLHGPEWSSARSTNGLIISSWNNSSLINKTEYLHLLISMLKIKDFKEIGFDTCHPELFSFSPSISNDKKTINHLLFEDLTLPTIKLDIHKRYRVPQLQPTLYSNLYTALAQFLMLVGV